jgi:hypothetical protein
VIDETPLGNYSRRVALNAVAKSYGYGTFQAFAEADLNSGGVGGSRVTFDLVTKAIAPLQAALAAVRYLAPPPIHSGDDPELHELLTEGWKTCHHTAVTAIETALEGSR